jgi:hypothetical protein
MVVCSAFRRAGRWRCLCCCNCVALLFACCVCVDNDWLQQLPLPTCCPLEHFQPNAGDFDLVWRPEAKVSVLDSGFLLGDGVWEGLRLHRGVLMFIQVGGWVATAGGWLGGAGGGGVPVWVGHSVQCL